MNKTWHEHNKMPKNATLEERLAWHQEHQKHCHCRPIPKGLLPLLRAERKAGAGADKTR
jgi:hypothetical protein